MIRMHFQRHYAKSRGRDDRQVIGYTMVGQSFRAYARMEGDGNDIAEPHLPPLVDPQRLAGLFPLRAQLH
ncbi:hypothetical protein M413DRAFT_439113 [Hebeloma cylindrosporum]|uniref:Uncharacterized protein n=1 Tax=Hebeloma cylindrosporum TaxID=76867 RepID=A0A0C3CFC3_HEBCY|nr:hypothetical protein M413DRAFT_439113 [Hebeloma cylindrosporum h7]